MADVSGRYTKGDYLERNPTWHAEDSPWKARQILSMIERHRLEPASVCEVGCGAGGILSWLHDRMPATTFVGYEISPQAYELARANERERVRFVLGDALADGRRYDLVLLIDLIEHLEDYFAFLRAVHSKGERTILHIPLELSAQGVLRQTPLLGNRDLVGHLHYFTKDIALRVLAESGYDVVDWAYTGGDYAVTLKQRLARRPRVVAQRLGGDAGVRLLGGYSLLVLAA